MGAPSGLSRTAGSYNKLPNVLYVFEHKTQYLLIYVPYIQIVVFWHISNISPYIVYNPRNIMSVECDKTHVFLQVLCIR